MFCCPSTTSDLNQDASTTFTMFCCPSTTSDLNQDADVKHLAKEVMFQKPLTPSDVGKLNRLVIPKQYAEKYFPSIGVSTTGEKGLLLSFKDEDGKFWRFRYSYWNSSQSYVLTKGWSRFIKEKQLHAGDLVLFARGGGNLFIGLQRHDITPKDQVGGVLQRPVGCTLYPSCLDAGENAQNHLHAGRSKIFRLFGVDMECQQPDEVEFIAATQDNSSPSILLSGFDPPAYMETTLSGDDIQD